MSDIAVKWSIEAPAEILGAAADAARIDPNAVDPGVLDAELIYPSFFCESRSAWIKALAYLYVRNLDFRLFLIGALENGNERWRYRIHPGMDQNMRDLMREIDAHEAYRLEHLEARFEQVAARLNEVPDEGDLLG